MCVIKIVGTTQSDLCFVILLWIDYNHRHTHARTRGPAEDG